MSRGRNTQKEEKEVEGTLSLKDVPRKKDSSNECSLVFVVIERVGERKIVVFLATFLVPSGVKFF